MTLDLLAQSIQTVYENRRQSAEYAYELKERAIYEAHPELHDADRAVSEAGRDLALASMQASREGAGREAQDALRDASEKLQAAQEARQVLWQRLGLSERDFEPQYHCPACQDRGYVGQKPCELCYPKTQARLLKEEFNKVMPQVGTLDDFSLEPFSRERVSQSIYGGDYSPYEAMSTYLRLARDFVDRFDEPEPFSLFFAGETGTGKSTLAGSIAQTLLEEGKAVIYISALELAGLLAERRTLRRMFRPDPERLSTVEQTLRVIGRCDLLIVDDIGDEREIYPESKNDFLQLVNERYPAGKKMIWVANDDPEAIKENYSESIFSRLFGYGATCFFFGEDLRIKKRL